MSCFNESIWSFVICGIVIAGLGAVLVGLVRAAWRSITDNTPFY